MNNFTKSNQRSPWQTCQSLGKRLEGKLRILLHGSKEYVTVIILAIPKSEFEKASTGSLNYKLKKKFNGKDFSDLFELVTQATRSEEIL